MYVSPRLLHGAVRQYLSENTSINVGTIPEWRDNLSKGTLNNQLRITPVRLDEDGESGEGIYRKLSPEVNTVRYSLSKANNTPEVIIIVDDFIGSGKQFLEYADKFKLADQLSSTKIVYCPLIGFEIGISTIQSKYPQLKILPAEYIYESDSLFFGKDNEKFKNDQENTIAEVKNFLIKMRGKYTPRMTGWLGREEAGLALAFEWGCPNQVPALLYMDHSPKTCDWQQLFSRRS